MKISLFLFSIVQTTIAVNVKNLVIFGDSNSDVGNSQRWSNGPLWSEYLALGWNASLYSFAYSGSVCDNAMYNIEDKVPSLKDQMEAYYDLNLNLEPKETVFAFWFGTQDVYQMSKRKGKQEPDYKEITDCIGHQLRVARKSFVSDRFIVINVAPLGLMPYYNNNNETSMNKSQAAIEMNRELEKDIANLNKHHHALEMDYLDINSLINDIMADPSTFDLKDSTSSYLDTCDDTTCKNEDYLWWDKTHFTTSFHKLIATSIIEAESYMPKIELGQSLIKQLMKPNSKFHSKKYKVNTWNKGVLEEIARLYDLQKTSPRQHIQPPLNEEELETISHNNTFFGLFFFFVVFGIIACLKFPRFYHRKFIPVRNEEF